MQKSFSAILLLLISSIYFLFGTLHLIFTKKITLFVINGANGEIANLLQQFLGSSYLLIGVLLYLLKDTKGRILYTTIGAINIIGFIHLYLIFLFHNIITLPFTYFLFIILLQICLFIALIEQLRKT